MSTSKRISSLRTSSFTLVDADGSRGYVAPYERACPDDRRYMAVHRVGGGGWGIVDRRTGRLLAEAQPDQHRYPSWHDVQAAVQGLNHRGSD